LMETSKRLAGVAIAVSSVALVTGCHSTKSSEASLYSEPVGATPSTSSQRGSSYAISSQASTSTQTTSASAQSTGQPQELKGDISIPLYEEQLAVGTRMVESGSVRLRKQVTTETVNQPVQIRRETLVVEREPGSAGSASSQETASTASTASTAGTAGTFTPFEQGEIVIKLHKEEPVVEKRVIATGRIVAKTATDTEQVTVSREVRKENIDVEKIGNPQNVTISENVGARSSDAVGGTGTASQQTKGSETKGTQDQATDPAKRTPPPQEK
jgi:stress response protein YsnF